MDLLAFVLLLAVGAAAGFLAGFFGLGGGILLVPVLLFYYGTTSTTSLVTTHLAFATNLLVVIFASAASAYQHDREDHVLWRAVLLWGAAGAVGSLAGAILASSMQGHTLRQIFAVVVVVAAFRLLSQPRKPKGNLPPEMAPKMLLPAGAIIGFAASLAGVGGGELVVPIMYSYFRFPLKKALGTSSAIIIMTAFAGAIGYAIRGWNTQGLPSHTLGYIDYVVAIPLILGSLPMSPVGAHIASKSKGDTLRKIFAVLLIAVAAKMLIG